RCSGAIALAASSAASGPSTTTARPPDASVDSISARRGASASKASTAVSTASATCSSQVTRIAAPSGPCSACASKSAATRVGSAVSSATTTSSDGPGRDSMPTMPATSRLASVTYTLPGPTTTSTGGIDFVPYANAAIACAPPTRYTSSTPTNAAAANVAAGTLPSGPGGTQRASSGTPATRAGIAVMRTVDG